MPERSAVQLESHLAAAIGPRKRVLTAFSGGIDSTLVAAVARRTLGRSDAPAVIGDSASLPRRELDDARALAVALDLDLHIAKPTEQDDPGYIANAGDRCYHCKSHLYRSMHDLAAELGIEYLANGTNADDLGDHRPGLRAADEAQIISPLLEAKMTKRDVRTLAQRLGLPNADKPAAACLASRLQFGTEVTAERLAMVERAEQTLSDLGFNGFRVRHHESPTTPGTQPVAIARIEVPAEQIPALVDPATRDTIVASLQEAGYLYVTVDLAGFRSGSGNAVLTVSASDDR